jgi:hypothetical protein
MEIKPIAKLRLVKTQAESAFQNLVRPMQFDCEVAGIYVGFLHSGCVFVSPRHSDESFECIQNRRGKDRWQQNSREDLRSSSVHADRTSSDDQAQFSKMREAEECHSCYLVENVRSTGARPNTVYTEE